MFGYQRRTRVLVVALLLLGLIVISLVAGVTVVNRRVLPRVAANVQSRAAALCRCEFQIGELRYRLFRTVLVHNLRAGLTEPDVDVTVRKVTIQIPFRGMVRLARGESFGVTMLSGQIPWSLMASAAGAGFVPDRFSVTDLTVRMTAPDGAVEVRVPELLGDHRPQEQRVLITVTENPSLLSSALVEIFYGERRFRAEADLTDIDLAVLSPSIRSGSGVVSAAVELLPDGAATVQGYAGATGVRLSVPVVAHETIEVPRTTYRFAAEYDPSLIVGPLYQSPPPFPALHFAHGKLTFTRGDFTLGPFAAEVLPTLRGVTGGAPPTVYDAAPLSNRSTWMGSAPGLGKSLVAVPRYLELALAVSGMSVRTLLDAIPDALLGPLESMQADGRIDWSGSVRAPLHSISWMILDGAGGIHDFVVSAIVEPMNVHRLAGAFEHEINDPIVGYRRIVRIPEPEEPPVEWLLRHSERSEGYIRVTRERRQESQTPTPRLIVDAPTAESGESVASQGESVPPLTGSPNPVSVPYRRLTEMSDHLISAVLTAEDGGFFFHDGVSFITLPLAIERNLQAGEVQFGASTISMQVAKMLFLDQQRIFSRKLQEVLLVYLMEHYVPLSKSRILELYLNLAEFGPGVFGVEHASRYYFGKDAGELDLGEATWLATILPSPKRFHVYFERGEVTPGWFARMQGLYTIMLERGRITEEEHAEAMLAPPRFVDLPEPPEELTPF